MDLNKLGNSLFSATSAFVQTKLEEVKAQERQSQEKENKAAFSHNARIVELIERIHDELDSLEVNTDFDLVRELLDQVLELAND